MKVHCYACDKIVEVTNMLDGCPNCDAHKKAKEACASAIARIAADRASETLNCLREEEKIPDPDHGKAMYHIAGEKGNITPEELASRFKTGDKHGYCLLHGPFVDTVDGLCPFCEMDKRSQEAIQGDLRVECRGPMSVPAKDVNEVTYHRAQPALGDCLDEAKKTICGERQDVYGNPEDSFALIAEYWSTYLRKEYNSDQHHLNAKDVAHMMILFKMGRVQGQAPKRDNYVDICGYASIAADRLHKED